MPIGSRVRSFFQELKRRKVFHVATVYLVTAWGASLGASELFPAFDIPDWAVRLFVMAAILGFPLALVLAWAFEITPEGVVLDDGRPRPAQDGASTATAWAFPKAMISWSDGDGPHRREISAVTVIGRDTQADLVLNESKVSRRHARLFYRGDSWWIEDLNSRNGTWVDGELISAAVPLHRRTEISLFDDGPKLAFEYQPSDITETEVDA